TLHQFTVPPLVSGAVSHRPDYPRSRTTQKELKTIFIIIYIFWRGGFHAVMANIVRAVFVLLFALEILSSKGLAQERPYFVTYDHHMEEAGNLEVATNPVIGRSSGIPSFIGNWTEIEYGAKGWWTTEFYMDGQHTRRDGSLFTGFRFEN